MIEPICIMRVDKRRDFSLLIVHTSRVKLIKVSITLTGLRRVGVDSVNMVAGTRKHIKSPKSPNTTFVEVTKSSILLRLFFFWRFNRVGP